MSDFDRALPHELPWDYPWIKDEIERRDEYIAQLEAELAHQRAQDTAQGAIECETVKIPAEDETEGRSKPDIREKKINMPYHNGEKQAKLMGKMYESFIIDEMPDTREKLEADVREWVKRSNAVFPKSREREFIGWLDRQAAITEVECIGRWDARAAIENADLKAEMAELTAMVERDYVPREDYEDLRDEFVWTNAFLHRMGKKCGTEDVPSLVAYVDKLESELDQWNKLATNIELPVSPITQFQPKDNERRIAELEAERDELKVCHKIALEGRDAAMDRAVALQARLEGLAEEVDSLRVQRNATAKRLMDAEKERTRLKDALGRAKGFAEGIGRL